MKLKVFSTAPIVLHDGKTFLYSPYQKEMEIWANYSDEIQFCCPIWNEDRNLLLSEISFPTSPTISLFEFNIKSIKQIFFTILKI